MRILDADSATGRGTAVAAGMYLSDDIYVEIITDAKGFTATQIEISLSRTLEPALAIRHRTAAPTSTSATTAIIERAGGAAIWGMVPRGSLTFMV